MRRLPVFVLALLFSLTSIGCDSASDDDPSDAEVFVGTWNLVSLSDNEGDKTAEFEQIADSFRAALTQAGVITITVDYTDETGFEPLVIPALYEVDEDEKELIVTIPSLQPQNFGYEIVNESRIRLSTDANFANLIFGSDVYVGTVVMTIEKV